MDKVIFFGNGPLAEYTLAVLSKECQVIFHVHSAADLEKACQLKRQHPEAHGVLASFGVIIRPEVLELFEPEGILNVHPSLLPSYRGPSPIETAIIDGHHDFSVSVMKLAKEMDAGPIYWQTTLTGAEIASRTHSDTTTATEPSVHLSNGQVLPLKSTIYQALAETGAHWICNNLVNLPTPVPQDDAHATYTQKLTKKLGALHPESEPADTILRQIIAFQGFPKPKCPFFSTNCIILAAHPLRQGETAVLPLKCSDGQILSIDRLQPEGRKPMDAKAFINGYKK